MCYLFQVENMSKAKFGESELHVAVKKGDIEKAKSLISEGADVNVKDNSRMAKYINLRVIYFHPRPADMYQAGGYTHTRPPGIR